MVQEVREIIYKLNRKEAHMFAKNMYMISNILIDRGDYRFSDFFYHITVYKCKWIYKQSLRLMNIKKHIIECN